jgi:hypothetical protein
MADLLSIGLNVLNNFCAHEQLYRQIMDLSRHPCPSFSPIDPLKILARGRQKSNTRVVCASLGFIAKLSREWQIAQLLLRDSPAMLTFEDCAKSSDQFIGSLSFIDSVMTLQYSSDTSSRYSR